MSKTIYCDHCGGQPCEAALRPEWYACSAWQPGTDANLQRGGKKHTTTSYSEAKANELGVNVTRGDIPPDPPNPEGRPPTPRGTGARDSALLFIGMYFGVAVALLILGLTGAIK